MPAQQGTGWREIWRERLLEFLRGNALGDVPASAGSPPLVEDARRRARSHRIDLSDGASRRRRLDIRRKRSHFAASRYLHAMTLLNSDFAEMRSGPDYLHGIRTDLLFEEWSYAWSPRAEGRLIELAALADDVPTACLNLLVRRRAELQAEGLGHRSIQATARYAHLAQVPLREATDVVGVVLTTTPAVQAIEDRADCIRQLS